MTGHRKSPHIVVYEEGPYLVRGPFNLISPEGESLTERPIIALCGCGRSQTAPLCDGSHKRAEHDAATDFSLTDR